MGTVRWDWEGEGSFVVAIIVAECTIPKEGPFCGWLWFMFWGIVIHLGFQLKKAPVQLDLFALQYTLYGSNYFSFLFFLTVKETERGDFAKNTST